MFLAAIFATENIENNIFYIPYIYIFYNNELFYNIKNEFKIRQNQSTYKRKILPEYS